MHLACRAKKLETAKWLTEKMQEAALGLNQVRISGRWVRWVRWVDGWVDGWVGGWKMGRAAVLGLIQARCCQRCMGDRWVQPLMGA